MPVFKSSRRVQKSGSSLAMTLPAMFVKANEIDKGTEVNVLFGLKGVLIVFVEEEVLINGIDEIVDYLTKADQDV